MPTPTASRCWIDGGLALRSNEDVLIAPTCCCDLGDLSQWKEAVAYRRPDWKMVWIGHPWLSVRFEAGRLVLSEPHESASPVARWTVSPDELGRAVAVTEAELEDFARRLRPLLGAFDVVDADAMARQLAGLGS